jgi:hypothetical protein
VRAVRYHPDASAEFLREIEYYLALSPALSERFDRAVLACEVRAAESPDRWPKHPHTFAKGDTVFDLRCRIIGVQEKQNRIGQHLAVHEQAQVLRLALPVAMGGVVAETGE